MERAEVVSAPGLRGPGMGGFPRKRPSRCLASVRQRGRPGRDLVDAAPVGQCKAAASLAPLFPEGLGRSRPTTAPFPYGLASLDRKPPAAFRRRQVVRWPGEP
jgi:hypothetical protein